MAKVTLSHVQAHLSGKHLKKSVWLSIFRHEIDGEGKTRQLSDLQMILIIICKNHYPFIKLKSEMNILL